MIVTSQSISEQVRAITLWQPWASLVALRFKQYETRSWPTKYRGKLLIHAATRKATFNPFRELYEKKGFEGLTSSEQRAYCVCAEINNSVPSRLGCVVAIADLTNCLRMVDEAKHYAWKNLKTGRINTKFNKPTKELLFEGSGFGAVRVDEPIKGYLAVPVAQDSRENWHEAIVISEQTDLERAVGDWAPGRYAWKLEKIQALKEPIYCKGAQGLWVPSQEIITAVGVSE